MGKSLIIKGANFSINGIQAEFLRLGWIGASTSNGDNPLTPNGQFISSGITTSLDVKMEITAQFIAPQSGETFSVFLPGCEISYPSAIRIWAQPTQVTARFGSYDSDRTTSCTLSVSKNLWDGNTHTVIIDKTGVVIDDASYTYDNEPDLMDVQPIYLDSCSKWSTGGYNTAALDGETPLTGKLRIKNVRIWSNYLDETSLVMNAIPVKKLSNNVICFYNSVDGTYKVRNNDSTPDYGL